MLERLSMPVSQPIPMKLVPFSRPIGSRKADSSTATISQSPPPSHVTKSTRSTIFGCGKDEQKEKREESRARENPDSLWLQTPAPCAMHVSSQPLKLSE